MSPRVRARRPGVVAVLLLSALTLATAGCASEPAPVATPTAVPSPTPTGTPTPTPTPTASPTPSPTPIPTPKPTPSASLALTDGPSLAGVEPCPGTDATFSAGDLASTFSSNWSGYATTATKRVVTCVESEWVQPKVACHGSSTSSVSIWVGLGGFDPSNALEQIGTAADCVGGVPLEYSWHEGLPRERHEIDSPVPISTGDRIWAQVRWIGGSSYQLSLANLTHPDGFTVKDTNKGLRRTEAEWIAEAPSRCSATCHVLPMPAFGKITFDHIAVTINGLRSTLMAAGFTRYRIRLLKGTTTRALVTSTSVDGSSFVVTWRHA